MPTGLSSARSPETAAARLAALRREITDSPAASYFINVRTSLGSAL